MDRGTQADGMAASRHLTPPTMPVPQAPIATTHGGRDAMIFNTCGRERLLQKITRPPGPAPCNRNSCFAGSTPIPATSSLDASALSGDFSLTILAHRDAAGRGRCADCDHGA